MAMGVVDFASLWRGSLSGVTWSVIRVFAGGEGFGVGGKGFIWGGVGEGRLCRVEERGGVDCEWELYVVGDGG